MRWHTLRGYADPALGVVVLALYAWEVSRWDADRPGPLLAVAADLEHERLAVADEMSFVGSTSAQGHLLPVVAGVARLHRRAKNEGADLIVVDTSGLVSGITGQVLKYHKIELLEPDLVVGLQRGEELRALLELVLGAAGRLRRLVDDELVPTDADHRGLA